MCDIDPTWSTACQTDGLNTDQSPARVTSKRARSYCKKAKMGHSNYYCQLRESPIVTPIDVIFTDVLNDLVPGEVVHVGTVVSRPVRKMASKFLSTNPAHKILLKKRDKFMFSGMFLQNAPVKDTFFIC